MPYPETWLKATVEAATGCPAYPLTAPEQTPLPYVIYGRQSTNREATLAPGLQAAVNPSGTFAVEVYASTYSAAKDAADAIRAALHNFIGTASGVTILHSLLTDERDGDVIFFDGQDRPTFVVEQTLDIRWQEQT
jgi:hypothetical protein